MRESWCRGNRGVHYTAGATSKLTRSEIAPFQERIKTSFASGVVDMWSCPSSPLSLKNPPMMECGASDSCFLFSWSKPETSSFAMLHFALVVFSTVPHKSTTLLGASVKYLMCCFKIHLASRITPRSFTGESLCGWVSCKVVTKNHYGLTFWFIKM